MFRTNLTIDECAALIETWEQDRCADGYENVFDLRNKNDFRMMVENHGFIKTRKLRKQNRFWFDGLNFKEPKAFPTTAEEARQLAENLIETWRVEERPDLYKAFLKS